MEKPQANHENDCAYCQSKMPYTESQPQLPCNPLDTEQKFTLWQAHLCGYESVVSYL